jgi:hypothetical protein
VCDTGGVTQEKNTSPELADVTFWVLRVCMALKALLCSGNDESPQHRSVLRAIRTLTPPPKYICKLGGLLPIYKSRGRGAQGLMWGTKGPFLLAAAMVCYSCVCQCWPLKANVRLAYCRNINSCLRKYFFIFLRRSHTFVTSDPSAK